MKKILYGPSDWIADCIDSRDRRMVAFWVFIVALVLYPFFGVDVFYASALGLIGVAGIFTSETPTETEDE